MTEIQAGQGKTILEVSSYCGIGVSATRSDLVLGAGKPGVVIDLVESAFETPAKRAGLEGGDIITHYRYHSEDDWSVMPKKDENVTAVLRGAQGSPISLRLIRARTGERYEVSMFREMIVDTSFVRRGVELRIVPEEDSRCEPLASLPTPSLPRLASRVGLSVPG